MLYVTQNAPEFLFPAGAIFGGGCSLTNGACNPLLHGFVPFGAGPLQGDYKSSSGAWQYKTQHQSKEGKIRHHEGGSRRIALTYQHD